MALGDMLGGIFGSGDAEKFGRRATRTAKKGEEMAQKATKQARTDVQTGITQGSAPLTQVSTLFDPLLGQKQSIYDLYADSLGVNGPEGNQRALGAYQHSPGYQFALDQALEGAQRNSAAAGNLNSGNTLMALSDRAQQLQNLDYGNWQDRLAGQDPTGLYGQKAQGLTNLGNFYGNQYGNLANVGLAGAGLQMRGNENVAAGLQNQAQIAGTNAAQGWSGLLGIGNLLTGGLGGFGGFGGGSSASGPGLAFGGGTVGPAVNGLPWLGA